MSPAALLAAIAGGCAAAAVVDLLATARRPSPEQPRARGRPTRLAGMAVLLARLARHAGMRAGTGDLGARISAAGAPLGFGAGEITALKAVGALGGVLIAAPAAGALAGRMSIVVLVAVPLAGFLAPELALARIARAREGQLAHELADVVDLLRVAVAAGLPAGRAMGEVGRRMRGVLAAELASAAARLELGVPRAEVLRELVARCPGQGVATLAAAITRADRHGAPLAPALAALAADARAQQGRRARDDAARAAPKIQLVVALVLVPAVMLLIGAVLVRGLDGAI